MAKQIWNNPINDNTDWGGDASTNNLPVSGTIVQKFIKDKFKGKVGCIYYDTTNNRYMMFADETARDTYLENPQDNAGLILGVFDAPFNYSAEINLITDSFNAILKGTTNNYIRFTFDVKNKNGQSTGEDVLCTFTFIHGSTKKTVNQKYRSGTSVSLNIDSYLETGANTITIAIVGQNSLAATTVAINYQVIDLNVSDNVDLSRVYKLGEDINIEIPYSVSGAGIKTMEWYLDGVLIPYVKDQDEITEIETSRIKYISLNGIEEGVHSLQYRASVIINGEKFYSNILYRDAIVYNEIGTDNMVAVGTTLPSTVNILSTEDQLKLYGVKQYMSYPIRIGVFNPTYAETTNVDIYIDSQKETILTAKNNQELTYNVLFTSYGEKTLKISTDNSEYLVGIDVEKSDTSVEEITQDLTLALSAVGKSNSSVDKNKWTFNDYSTTFNNFKWNDSCGWNQNSLIISEGASININYAPLASNSTNTGKTFEIEFASSNVANNNAIICDLRNTNGTGILITASEASIVSAGGSKVSTKYKAEENIRIGFVINRSAGVANKTLIMMYINGILSGAASYAVNDNFISNTNITISSTDEVSVILKSIRIYDTALSSNQILNNYILYRETSEELLKIYDRNDIYEEGTSNFSTDKLAGQLPIMIVTGNIPALEATTDKNLQIDVDVEYTNFQNPKLSFSIKNGALRPQGTSSMGYPKKNFRLYTQKKDNTILYDADGNVVESKLYAFKEGSQPVNCWCFKADYAESSGTHNTGVARLWNDVFKNFQINGQYKGRTKAQQAAIDGNYPYDVRTCIDGFPILMFYRLDENSPLVFIGKYNFNNDKSTESVFGYRDIPGFDNSNVQCWETLTNGNHLALFQDVANWDEEWSDAFEARYPDGNEDTTKLKTFATWMSSVTKEDFVSQKWNHLDLYKVAAYYVYFMRFGAVDQTVKNTMLVTENGIHWFFENYDNDTIGSLRNDGLLIFKPTITRQTLDDTFTSGVYAYAGHDSRLWNMLEDDEEFMSIVREVDQALYTAGLTYNQVIEVFDTKQANKWCERVYNQDAQYKYIGPFADKGINNLFMLQGSRQSHRRWWFSERFALMDSIFVSGEYKSNVIELKLAGAPIGLEFNIKAGKDYNYGYGVNNVPISSGINLKKGQSHTFATTSVLNVGDPLRIYAAPYLEKVDISNLSEYITQLSIANVYSERLGSKLKYLIIGGTNSDTNTSLTSISGLNQAVNLRELYIKFFKGITFIDLSNNTHLEVFQAVSSGLTSAILPKNAPLKNLQLPNTIQSLSFNGLYNLNNEKLFIQDNGNKITSIEILDCPKLNTKTIVENFLLYKQAADSACSLTINGINWTDVDPVWLIRLGNFANLNLKGMIEITDITLEQLTTIQNIFGNNCFSPKSELYIKAPIGTYFIGPDSVRGYSNTKYEFVVAGAEGTTELYLENNTNSLISFVNNRLIVGDITSNTNVTLVAKFVNSESGVVTTTRKTISCVAIKYPTTGRINMDLINKQGIYECYITLTGTYDDDAKYYTEWSIEGDAIDNGSIELGTTTNTKAIIICNTVINSDFTIKAILKRQSTNDILITINSNKIYVVSGNIIMTKNTNRYALAICYENGWCANTEYMTDVEASNVLEITNQFVNASSFDSSFEAFQYFININLDENTTFRGFPSSLQKVIISQDVVCLNNFLSVNEVICYGTTIKNSKNSDSGSIRTKTLSLPNATTFIGFFPDSIFNLNAPKLKIINNTYPYSIFTMKYQTDFFELPELETITNTKNYPIIKGNSLTNITLPKLKNIDNGNTNKLEYFIYNNNSKLTTLDLPLLEVFKTCFDDMFNLSILNLNSCKEFITGGYYSRYYGSSLKSITELNLPECETLECRFNASDSDGNYSLTTINTPKVKNILQFIGKDLINLQTFNFVETIEHANNIILPDNFLSGELHFRNLSKIGSSFGNNIFSSENITKLYFYKDIIKESYNTSLFSILPPPNCEELYIYGKYITSYSEKMSNNESIKKIVINNLSIDTNLSFENLPNLEQLEINNTDKIFIVKNCPKLNSVSYKGITTSNYMDGNQISHIKFPDMTIIKNEFIFNSSAANNIIEVLEFEKLNSIYSFNKFNYLKALNTIILNQSSFPAISFNISGSLFIGTEVPEGTPKVIYIQVGATGFDDKWQAFCDATGFTVSYTLPADETNAES